MGIDMKRNEMEGIVFRILQERTGVDFSKLGLNDDLEEHVDLDSVQMVSIGENLENELKIDIPISVMGVNNLRDLFNIIEAQLDKKHNSKQVWYNPRFFKSLARHVSDEHKICTLISVKKPVSHIIMKSALLPDNFIV